MKVDFLEKAVVFIVDDNTNNVEVLFDFLSEDGFNILVATDGESAIEQIEYALPDLILLDVLMPGIDGFETCSRLKSNPVTKDIPVIFMTALTDTLDKVKGFKLGAVDYITKPVQQEEVLARVKTHLTICNLQKKLHQKNLDLEAINRHLEKLVTDKTKELIEKEKTAIVGRLTQGMIHNLRNPLQTIMGFTDIIAQQAKSTENTSLLEFNRYIQDAANHINQVVTNLMLKVRRDQTTELKSVNLNELLNSEMQLLSADHRFKYRVKKEILLDKNLPELHLIPSHISQVFHNLVNNALDAMWQTELRKITIMTRQDESQVYIDIKDNGCGIPAEKLAMIFDVFYTTKPAKGDQQDDEPTGTGLGLPTCLELLKPFNGTISVSSEIDNGTVFTIILPKPVAVSDTLNSSISQLIFM